MILEIIKNRRAVFPNQYNGESISIKEIETILESANWAPSHKRTEPWRFKVMQGDSLEKLGKFLADTYRENSVSFSEYKFKKYRQNPEKAACVIAICMQRNLEGIIPEWEEIAATAMAVQNMWLTASHLQIGCYWSSPEIVSYMGDFIDLQKGERCLGFFYLGKYNDPLPRYEQKSSIADKTVWI